MDKDSTYNLSEDSNNASQGEVAVDDKKRTVIIILIFITFLFTILSLACILSLYNYSKNRELSEAPEESVSEGMHEATDTEDSNSLQDEGEEDEEVSTDQPKFDAVFDKFKEQSSYRFQKKNIDDMVIVNGVYVSPDREQVEQIKDGSKVEEVALGDKYYRKEEGGVWFEIDNPEITGFHDEVLSIFMTSLDSYTLDGSVNGSWKYSSKSDVWDKSFYVSKKGLLLEKIEFLSEGSLKIEVVISDHNLEEIEIESPV